jgi:hypothetical protein
MRSFIRKLLLSDLADESLNHNVLYNQWKNLLDIWDNRGNSKSNAIGIERIVKLLLIFSQFITPSIYFRAFFGSFGKLKKHLGVELYVVSKLFISFYIVNYCNVSSDKLILCWCIIMIAETVLYSANLVINQDTFSAPHSYKRNILLVLVDYMQLNFDFASLYLGFHAIKKIVDSRDVIVTQPIDTIYFSFISSLTIGYGDIVPANLAGKRIVICQILTFLVIGILVINFYSAQVAASNSNKN